MIRPLKFIPLGFAILGLATILAGTASLRAQTMPTAEQAGIASLRQEQAKEDAQLVAAAWLKLIDGGKYAESWQSASELFHKSITQDGWISLLKGGLPVFGNVVSRKLKTAAYGKILPGAPDGQYVVLEYDTDFANTKTAVETVATAFDADGTWKIIGYHIK